MSADYDKVRDIARASLMPDFFAVRIEEDGLFATMQELIDKIRFPSPLPAFERIQQLSMAAADPMGFIDAVKAQNLWTTLRDVLAKVKVS